jgi:hypothetical protein
MELLGFEQVAIVMRKKIERLYLGNHHTFVRGSRTRVGTVKMQGGLTACWRRRKVEGRIDGSGTCL